jgi:murein L,D-transpeptidase YafK
MTVPSIRRTLRISLWKGLAALAVGLCIAAVGLSRTPIGFSILYPTSDDGFIEHERRTRYRAVTSGQTLPGTPDLAALDTRLAEHGVALGAAVFMRVFKREFELELWMKRDGRFHKFATYPICRYSGGLGPKVREGDKQAPEGFYTIGAKQLNPRSNWHRAFNLGYPNAHDSALGRTGSFVMIHGGCSSIGCYAMTDAVVDELWQIVTAALNAGQPRFQLQVFPFRMSEANLAARANDASAVFWQDLKTGHDAFDTTQLPPRVSVCHGRYVATSSTETKEDGRNEIVKHCEPHASGRAAALVSR